MTDIDQHRIRANAGYLTPINPQGIFSVGNTEKRFGHKNCADFPAFRINEKITDKTEPSPVADVDHIFFAQL